MIKNRKWLIIIITILLVISILILLIYMIYKKMEDDKIKLAQKRKEIYESAVSYCSSLFENGIAKDTVTIENLDECLDKTKLVYDKDSVISIKNDVYSAKEYINIKDKVNNYYQNGVVISSISLEQIDTISKDNKKLDEKYKSIIQSNIDELTSEYNNIKNAQSNVHNLFSDYDNDLVNDDIDRDSYDSAKEMVNSLKEEDIKNNLNEKMNIVLKYVEEKEAKIREQQRLERERIAREAEERRRAINESWVKLNVPYISQNKNGVLNGCEASSMLMALQYKGYLGSMDLRTYATNMPKSDDPNIGFYLDIFGKEPLDVAHWIAPNPLVEYGISSSGYSNIVNISGSSIDDIANEIINGNPVIIYLTYAYNNPYNWSNGAPKNIHVQLVIGYNKLTGDFIIQDPWTRTSGQYQFTLSKNKISNLYSSVGSMAVVVR